MRIILSNHNFNKSIFTLACFFFSLLLPSFSHSALSEVLKGRPISCCLPVNVAQAKDKKTYLTVNIPEGYKCLQEDLLENMLEFIPEKDNNPYKWSEIITIHKFTGKFIKAKEVTEIVLRNIKTGSSTSKVLNSSSEDFNTFSTSSFTLVYEYNDRKEIVYVKYFSGPYDCSGFQYAILIKDQMTEESALERIKKFEKEETFLIN